MKWYATIDPTNKRIVITDGVFSDWPVFYKDSEGNWDGRVGYDHPEKIPNYAKDQAKMIYRDYKDIIGK